MSNVTIPSYTFDATNKRITFPGYYQYEQLTNVLNVTRQKNLYQRGSTSSANTTCVYSAGNTTITLVHDTSGMANSDQIQITFDTQDTVPGLIIPQHDYLTLSYDANNNITGVTYKLGGASGNTVATLTLNYAANNNLMSVSRT